MLERKKWQIKERTKVINEIKEKNERKTTKMRERKNNREKDKKERREEPIKKKRKKKNKEKESESCSLATSCTRQHVPAAPLTPPPP